METSKLIKEFRAQGVPDEVDVRWVSGGVTLCESETDEIYAQQKGARTLPQRDQMQVYFENGRLLVEVLNHNSGWGRWSSPDRTFLYLYLPRTLLRRLSVKGVSNWVAGNEVTAREVSINMVSGDVRLEGRMDTVDANFVSGKMELTFIALPSKVNFRNVSGSCVLRLPDNDGIHLTQSVLSGHVDCVFPVLGGGFGDGKPEVRVSGVSSTTRIERL